MSELYSSSIRDRWRNIPIELIERIVSVNACFRQRDVLSVDHNGLLSIGADAVAFLTLWFNWLAT
jgi:hypothetical protein